MSGICSVDDPVFKRAFVRELEAECEVAMERLQQRLEPDGTACKHGEFLGCQRCFSEALAAWCPRPGEESAVFFGADRSRVPNVFTLVDAEPYQDMYDVGTEDAHGSV